MSTAPPAGPLDAAALRQRLRDGPHAWVPLEDFVPLPQCLEWRLSRAYWDQRGSAAFFGGEVPYTAINDGRLSCDTARLLVELCQGDAGRRLRVLEVGGGSGLFARLLLDELRDTAPGLHARTTYVWTDGAAAMVDQVRANGMFSGHAGQVTTLQLAMPEMDALDAALRGDGFDLVIANYAVDNLPATMLRLGSDGPHELQVRAALRADVPPQRLGGRTPSQWAEALQQGRVTVVDAVELYPWFSLDCRYQPVDPSDWPHGLLLGQPPQGATWHWMHHAVAWGWLGRVLPMLRPGGGVLINDYGYRPSLGAPRHDAFQHFGPSLANGLNLDELQAWVQAQPGWAVAAPPQDSRQVSSRWIGRADDPLSAGIFGLVFDGPRRDLAMDLLADAEAAAQARHLEQARWLFWRARESAPRCWHVLERWAAFCRTRLQDASAAIGLAEAGLALHPHHPGLLNTLGDAHYDLGQLDAAQAAYRRALAASPRDIRARLNLAFVCQDHGRHQEALQHLAEGLALDAPGDWRDALLEKQRQVLLSLSLQTRDAIVQQMNRFRNLDAPTT
ncbi:MAG: SAM-dependent methyltransferase [Aquabacterium sp.]